MKATLRIEGVPRGCKLDEHLRKLATTFPDGMFQVDIGGLRMLGQLNSYVSSPRTDGETWLGRNTDVELLLLDE